MIVIAQQTKPWAEFFKKSFFTSDFKVSIPERVKNKSLFYNLCSDIARKNYSCRC